MSPPEPPWLEYDGRTGRLRWSAVLDDWHDLPPGAEPSWRLMNERRHPDDASGVEAAVARCLSDGSPICELHRIAADAGWRWVILTAHASRDADGAVTG